MTETLKSKEFRAIHEVLAKHIETLEKISEADNIEEVKEELPDVNTDNYDEVDVNHLQVHMKKEDHMEAVKALIDDLHQTNNQNSDEPVTNFFNKKEKQYL